MTAREAKAEVFWTAFKALSKREREAVVSRLLRDEEFVEDLSDLAIVHRRRNEPTIPLEDYLKRRRRHK